MRGVGKVAGAIMMAATMAIGFWSAAPANAATQAELEAKIKMMEQTLNEMKGQLKQVQTTQVQQQQAVQVAAANKLPSWVERMTFYGDTRFRYEHTSYDDLNGKTKTKSGKDRFRVRLRFGVRSQIHEDVELGFRMVTGADDDATSTNQTMGNYFGEYSKWGLDRAYVKWTPSFVPQKGLAFSFGKVPPALHDLQGHLGRRRGARGWLRCSTPSTRAAPGSPTCLAAYMTVEQAGEFSDNVLAPAAQIGVHGKVGAFSLKASTGYTSWGDLGDVGKVPDTPTATPPGTEGGGERMSNFGVWDIYAKGSFKFDKKGSVFAWGHYLTNQDADGPYSRTRTPAGARARASSTTSSALTFGTSTWRPTRLPASSPTATPATSTARASWSRPATRCGSTARCS